MDTFVNDTIQLIIDTNIDVSGYIIRMIKYRKPDGTIGCWPAALCLANNNCLTYTTSIGDLDQPGEWLIQASVRDTGVALHGAWIAFDVHRPLLATCPPPTTTLTTAPPTTTVPTTLSSTTALPTTVASTTPAPTTATITTIAGSTGVPATTEPVPTTFYPTTAVPTTGPATTPSGTTGVPATTNVPTTGP